MRGAAPVGLISDLAPLEAAAVLYLRLWRDSPDSQRRVRDDFAAILGPAAGDRAMSAIADFCGLCARHGRRALMTHHPACRHIGADEACLANLVALAIEAEREDAVLIATLLVRPDISLLLVAAAQGFGLALSRMVLKTSATAARAHPARYH